MPIAKVKDEAKAIHDAFVARLADLAPGRPVNEEAVAKVRAERLQQLKERLDAVIETRDREIEELEKAIASILEEGAGEQAPRAAPKKKRKAKKKKG